MAEKERLYEKNVMSVHWSIKVHIVYGTYYFYMKTNHNFFINTIINKLIIIVLGQNGIFFNLFSIKISIIIYIVKSSN